MDPRTPLRVDRKMAAMLRVFLRDPLKWQPGNDVWRSIGGTSGASYVTLAKLERDGWVESTLESDRPAGVLSQRLYRLTTAGMWRARETKVLEEPVSWWRRLLRWLW